MRKNRKQSIRASLFNDALNQEIDLATDECRAINFTGLVDIFENTQIPGRDEIRVRAMHRLLLRGLGMQSISVILGISSRQATRVRNILKNSYYYTKDDDINLYIGQTL